MEEKEQEADCVEPSQWERGFSRWGSREWWLRRTIWGVSWKSALPRLAV